MKKVLILGLLVTAITAGLFFMFVGPGKVLSPNGSDWANFGSYFGGVVAPIFSFLSILLLVFTVGHQSDEAQKLDLLRYVSRTDEEIEQWLKTELVGDKSGAPVQLGLIVWGVVPPTYVSSKELVACLERLLNLTSSYCSSIVLYRANGDPYFVYKAHHEKAIGLIKFLESQKGNLNSSAGETLKMCKKHLKKIDA